MVSTIFYKIFLILFSTITLVFVETSKKIELNELNTALGFVLVLALLFRIFLDFVKKYLKIDSLFVKSLKHK